MNTPKTPEYRMIGKINYSDGRVDEKWSLDGQTYIEIPREIFTARDAALEKTLREKVNDIRAAFEGTTPSDTDRAYLAALIDFDAIITATLSGDTPQHVDGYIDGTVDEILYPLNVSEEDMEIIKNLPPIPYPPESGDKTKEV